MPIHCPVNAIATSFSYSLELIRCLSVTVVFHLIGEEVTITVSSFGMKLMFVYYFNVDYVMIDD